VAQFSGLSKYQVIERSYLRRNIPENIHAELDMFSLSQFLALVPHVPEPRGEKSWDSFANEIASWADDWNGQIPPAHVIRNCLKGIGVSCPI